MASLQFKRITGTGTTIGLGEGLIQEDISLLSDFTVAEVDGYDDPSNLGDTGGGLFYLDKNSMANDDGGLTFKPNGIADTDPGRWIRNVTSTQYRAAWFGIEPGTADQTTRLNEVLALTYVNDIILDFATAATINGTLSPVNTKRFVFKNGCKLTGTGTVGNVFVDADELAHVFATGLTVTNLANPLISIRWFGAKADSHYDTDSSLWTDNRPLFLKAVGAGKSTNAGLPIIKIPSNEFLDGLGNFYYFSDGVDISKSITVEGDSKESTWLYFQSGKPGFKTLALNTGFTGLSIKGGFGDSSYGFNSDTAHGIWLASNGSWVDNCNVACFDGDGIFVGADEYHSGTNANQCRVSYTRLYGNGRHGLHTQGGDTNACSFYHLDCSSNGRWNVFEASFLGNAHTGHHNADGAIGHANQKTFVSYVHNGVTKYLFSLNDNVNKEPYVASDWQTFWEETTLVGSFTFPWSRTTQYYTGGGYYLSDLNNRSVFTGCYAEPNQRVLLQASNSIIVGGNLGLFSQGTVGVLVNDFGTLSAGSIGSKSAAASYYFDTRNPNYHGFFMQPSTGYWTSQEAYHGYIQYRWANINGGAYIINPEYSSAALGRTTTPAETAFMSLALGMYMRNVTNGNVRLLGTADAVPTTDEWATGDLLLNNGTSNPYAIFYKCTAGGTPGTWTTLSSGVPMLDQVLNAGDTSAHVLRLVTDADTIHDGLVIGANSAGSNGGRILFLGAWEYIASIQGWYGGTEGIVKISAWSDSLNALRDVASFRGSDASLTLAGKATVDGLKFSTLPPEYADDSAAAGGGLSVGDVYRTSSVLKVVVAV